METDPAGFRTDPMGTPGEPQIRHRCPARWVRLANPASHRLSARGLVAPLTLPVCGDVDVLAPPLIIGGVLHRVRLLNIGATPHPFVRDTIMSAADDADATMSALDIILHSCPAGRS
ncbi:MAG: hypothetical protein ACJ8AI_29925 [Rhodopila sp.]